MPLLRFLNPSLPTRILFHLRANAIPIGNAPPRPNVGELRSAPRTVKERLVLDAYVPQQRGSEALAVLSAHPIDASRVLKRAVERTESFVTLARTPEIV